MTDYYDLVLGLIPLTVVAVAGVLAVIGIEMSFAVSAGAVSTVPIIGHAMFVRSPTRTSRTATRTASSRESNQTDQPSLHAAD